MSTLNSKKYNFLSTPPKWTCRIPEGIYHKDARCGSYVSASMLREFRRCPAHYNDIVNGRAERAVRSSAFRLGRAVHKLVLEGEGAYRSAFVVGGPFNAGTGRAFGHGTRAFSRWLEEYGLDGERVVTPSEEEDMRRMLASLRGHGEASRLLGEGGAELVVRGEVEGVGCQARLDWLRPDGVVVDLKTVSDIGRFEADARRFGYLHQFAFYRDVVCAAGGGEVEMVAVVVERRAPFRVGVWRFSGGVLEGYGVENRWAVQELRRCREEGRWETGYEGVKVFPPAGLPPLWLN